MAPKEDVRGMFNEIALKYDYLNHLLSLGIDRVWRKKLRREMRKYKPENILDVATGTADVAIELSKLPVKKIVGIDITERMLDIGEEKIRKLNKEHLIELIQADSEKLPFPDNTFDAATVAFGVRNFETPTKGIDEIFRVIKSGGVLMVLEFGMPDAFPMKQVYGFYFKFVLPLWGKIFSGSYKSYKYLPESVKNFPYGDDFCKLLTTSGFEKCQSKKLSMGISYLYIARKSI